MQQRRTRARPYPFSLGHSCDQIKPLRDNCIGRSIAIDKRPVLDFNAFLGDARNVVRRVAYTDEVGHLVLLHFL